MMNRADFMKNLAELLADVPPTERDEAIQYYNDYFDDAGEENEQSVIESLGTPWQLAESIKAGLADGGNIGEFTEKGFSSYSKKPDNEVLDLNSEKNGQEQQNQKADDNRNYNSNYNSNYASGGSNGYNGGQNYDNGQNAYGGYREPNLNGGAAAQSGKKPMSGGTIALIVILCILGFPFIVGIGGGLFGACIGLLAGLFGIVIGFGAAAVALIAVGVCLFIYGIILMFTTPLAGLYMIGGALVCLAIGLLFLWLTVMICGALIPAIFRGIAKLAGSILGKGGSRA